MNKDGIFINEGIPLLSTMKIRIDLNKNASVITNEKALAQIEADNPQDGLGNYSCQDQVRP